MNEVETFFGLIEGTADALRVFELCRRGKLGRVRRRLHEKERKLIRSGSVFVFDEVESGIKRWTDGRLWSPSRILGNFLIYRELERRSTSGGGLVGENNEIPVRPILPATVSRPLNTEMVGDLAWLTEPVLDDHDLGNGSGNGNEDIALQMTFSSSQSSGCIDPIKTLDYPFNYRHRSKSVSEGCAASLIGPNAFRLLNSKKLQTTSGVQSGQTRYVFKSNGLLKKTISAKVDGRMQHLVCYFSEVDFLQSHSPQSSSTSTTAPAKTARDSSPLMEELRKTRIPPDLVLQQNFRKQPTTEYGFPLPPFTPGIRRNSVNVPVARPHPIVPRINHHPENEITTSTSLSSSSIDINCVWNAEIVNLNEAATPTSGSAKSPLEFPIVDDRESLNLIDECIGMAINNVCTSNTSGLSLRSEDPVLPVIERPSSSLGF